MILNSNFATVHLRIDFLAFKPCHFLVWSYFGEEKNNHFAISPIPNFGIYKRPVKSMFLQILGLRQYLFFHKIEKAFDSLYIKALK
jgi:hypothetical protein